MMTRRSNSTSAFRTSTRRQMITRVVVAIGSLAAGSKAWGRSQQQTPRETPGTATNHARTSLHQEVNFKATPQRIYNAFLDSKQFASITGMPAEIYPQAGSAFSMFGGMIVGRNIELVPAQRIVQAWRPNHWDAGLYSLVRFELKPRGTETTIVLDHSSFPEGEFDSLSAGWKSHYWDPLKKFFA